MVAKKLKKQLFEMRGTVSSVATDAESQRFLVSTFSDDSAILTSDSDGCGVTYTAGRCLSQNDHGIRLVTSALLLSGTQSDVAVFGGADGSVSLISFDDEGAIAPQKVTSARDLRGGQDERCVVAFAQFPTRQNIAWCTESACNIFDPARDGVVIASLASLLPDVVGVVATGRNELAVASAGGSVLLYDLRAGLSPVVGMEILDTITALGGDGHGNVVCGTALGRLVRMRASDAARAPEMAAGVSKRRSPVIAVSASGSLCACGDDSGRVTLMDLDERGDEAPAADTQVWPHKTAVRGVGLVGASLLTATAGAFENSELSIVSIRR